MTLPRVTIEVNDEDPYATRVWLTLEDGQTLEVTNFCQAVRQDPAGLVSLRLIGQPAEHHNMRVLNIDVNERPPGKLVKL